MINILVVEDDSELNKIVCTYLNDSGFNAKGCKMQRMLTMRCTTIYMN
jgi:DNA-binding response OmpR family regulator